MAKARLLTKIIGKSVSALKSAPRPAEAVTFDLVKGISSKGKFNIFTYKNAAGKPIARFSTYVKDGEKLVEHRIYSQLENFHITQMSTRLNNGSAINENKIIAFDSTKASKDAWMFDIKPRSEFDDIHRISYLSPGKKAQNLSFNTFYDGDVPLFIKATNTGKRTLAKRNREFLPLVTSEYMPNVERKVSHISALQENKFHLEDVLPPIQRVPHESIQHSVNSVTNGTVWGNCNIYTGQIKYSDELYCGRGLLETLAHEYKHASDASKTYRLQSSVDQYLSCTKEELDKMTREIEGFSDILNFNNNSIKRGIIKNNTKGGQRFEKIEKNWEIEDQIPYFERPNEIRARQASAEQLQRYDSCWNNLRKLFSAKFVPREV